MLKSKPKIRLFVDIPLAAGSDLNLDDAPAHYLAHVMRVRAGESLLLFNGRDGEWMATVDTIAKNRCAVSVDTRTRAQHPEHGPWLAFAPVKKTAVDFIAEKATELGVSRLCPTYTSRTAVSRVNVGRLRANAIEAAEQSERLSVPDVMDPVPLKRPAGAMAARTSIVHDAWKRPRPTHRTPFFGDPIRLGRPGSGCSRLSNRSGRRFRVRRNLTSPRNSRLYPSSRWGRGSCAARPRHSRHWPVGKPWLATGASGANLKPPVPDDRHANSLFRADHR